MANNPSFLDPKMTPPTFEEWLKQVNAILLREFGLSSEDLPDQLYADMYEDGLTAQECVEAVREELDYDESDDFR